MSLFYCDCIATVLTIFFQRTRIIPNAGLQKMIWPWIDEEIERVWKMRQQLDIPKDAGMTAVAFLRMLKGLRAVILQDAAALLLEAPERKNHCFFSHPIFSCDDFVAFREEMEDKLDGLDDKVQRASIDSVLPGVNIRLDRIEGMVHSQDARMEEMVKVLKSVDDRLNTFQSQVLNAASVLAGTLQQSSTSTEPTTTYQEEADDIVDEEENSDFETAKQYWMIEKFQSVQQMVDCWFGVGDHRDLPIEGGIAECEKRWKNKWRKHWNTNTYQKRFSRLKTIVLSIGGDRSKLRQLEYYWQKNQSLCGLVQECQTLGYRATKSRKRSNN